MSRAAKRQHVKSLWWLMLSASFGSTGLVQAGLALEYGAEWPRALAFGLVLAAFGCALAAEKTRAAHLSTHCHVWSPASASARQQLPHGVDLSVSADPEFVTIVSAIWPDSLERVAATPGLPGVALRCASDRGDCYGSRME
jgi:hypothetical protein